MTTIATDGKCMAADSLETAGNAIVGTRKIKIWKLDDGRIVGGAGLSTDIQKMLVWLRNPDQKPPRIKEARILVLNTDGTAELYEDTTIPNPQEIPTAIGTGYKAALTAMDMGGDAKKAVEMAIKRDTDSGGKVRVLCL